MHVQFFWGISNFNCFENRRTHDPRKPLEPNYPAVIPSLADFPPSGDESFTREKKVDIVVLSEEKERAKLLHAPPGSVLP